MLVVLAQYYTRRALRRQIGADFPKTAAHRPAQRHSDWPVPLRPQKVFPYGVTFGFRQFLQPLPHRLSRVSGSEKDQRDLLWRWVFRHSLPSLYLMCHTCTINCACLATSHRDRVETEGSHQRFPRLGTTSRLASAHRPDPRPPTDFPALRPFRTAICPADRKSHFSRRRSEAPSTAHAPLSEIEGFFH